MEPGSRPEMNAEAFQGWASMQGQSQSSLPAAAQTMAAGVGASYLHMHQPPMQTVPVSVAAPLSAQSFTSMMPLHLVHASNPAAMLPTSMPFSFPVYPSAPPMMNYSYPPSLYGFNAAPATLCTFPPAAASANTTWYVPPTGAAPAAMATGFNHGQQPMVTVSATCAASQTSDHMLPSFSSSLSSSAAAAGNNGLAQFQTYSSSSSVPQTALHQFQPLSFPPSALPAINLSTMSSPRALSTASSVSSSASAAAAGYATTPSPVTVSPTPPPFPRYSFGQGVGPSSISTGTGIMPMKPELLSPQSTHSSQSDVLLLPATGATPTSVTESEIPSHAGEVKLSHPRRKQRHHSMSSCSPEPEPESPLSGSSTGSNTNSRRCASAASSPTAAQFVCSCGRRYQTKSCLMRHKRTSCTGSALSLSPSASSSGAKPGKPYACRFMGCDRRFADISNAKRHELTHIRFKPFRCPVNGCAQHVSRKQALLLHLFKLHDITSGPIYESAMQQAPVSSIDELLESQTLPEGFDMTKPIRVKEGSPKR